MDDLCFFPNNLRICQLFKNYLKYCLTTATNTVPINILNPL